jgi:hypothetical protein
MMPGPRLRPLWRRALALGAALSLAAPLGAQVATIDEGSFTLFLGAERVGREEFSIRRVPDGGRSVLLLQSTTVLGDRRLSPALRADSSGLPITYQLELREDGTTTTRVSASAGANRLALRVTTARGESARQLPLPAGTVILDEDVVHQYYLVAARPVGPVSLLVPRRLGREDATLTRRADGPVEIGTGTLPARHLVLTDGAGVTTDIWTDAGGRLLRVAVPARGFLAVRDEPPR